MQIRRDRQSGLWELDSQGTILYQGRRSPWDHPEIVRAAHQTQDQHSPAGPAGPGRASRKSSSVAPE